MYPCALDESSLSIGRVKVVRSRLREGRDKHFLNANGWGEHLEFVDLVAILVDLKSFLGYSALLDVPRLEQKG